MKIIDSHVHFWDPEVLDYAWLDEAPAIQGAHLPEHYTEATAGLDIAGLIFVEADCHAGQALKEAEWIGKLAQSEPRIQGLVAAAPLELGASGVADHLKCLAEHSLVRGVRRLIQAEARGFCTTPAFMEAVQSLPAFGFSFDLCIKHPQFPDVLSLVEACPETAFVLDHIGKPDIAQGRLDPWRRHVDALAAYPQVAGCKLSGLITEADWERWRPDDLRPYVSHVIEAFGPDRLLYGSDWPVSVLAGGYARWWEAFDELTGTLPPEDREQIVSKTATRVYRLS